MQLHHPELPNLSVDRNKSTSFFKAIDTTLFFTNKLFGAVILTFNFARRSTDFVVARLLSKLESDKCTQLNPRKENCESSGGRQGEQPYTIRPTLTHRCDVHTPYSTHSNHHLLNTRCMTTSHLRFHSTDTSAHAGITS